MTNRLRAWGPAAVWAAVLFFVSSLPGDDLPPVLFQGEDKLAHLGLYTVLGATLAWGRLRSLRPAAAGALIALGILYGISDEWHQAFVPGRDASFADWIADTAGVLLGYWIVSSIVRHRGAPGRGYRPYESTPETQPE